MCLRLRCVADWDLGVCLQYECKRKQLHKPDVLNSWIDLRSTYRVRGEAHSLRLYASVATSMLYHSCYCVYYYYYY